MVDGLADVFLLRRSAFPVLGWWSQLSVLHSSLSSVKAPVNLLSVAFGSPPSLCIGSV